LIKNALKTWTNSKTHYRNGDPEETVNNKKKELKDGERPV
jgi:hypothetical protein